MPHAQLTEAVRHRVSQTFAQLGLAAVHGLRESILIRGGAYCGRRFDSAAGHAIWFLEENQIKFYDAAGRLAEVAETSAPERTSQRAAA